MERWRGGGGECKRNSSHAARAPRAREASTFSGTRSSETRLPITTTLRMNAATTTLLGAVLRASAVDEGGLRALARIIGISRQSLHHVLAGRVPGKHVIGALARYLEVSSDEVTAWAHESGG